MSKVERFEDLIAWQKTKAVSREIYALTRKRDFGHDFGLINKCSALAFR